MTARAVALRTGIASVPEPETTPERLLARSALGDEQACVNREDRAERLDLRRPYDDVTEATLDHLDHAQVRAALAVLTELSTVKTRMRDGLIRLRDARGVHR
ncbi:hypothetical protein ACIRSS_05745 [Amycolatopsis sp. NPDC101161]|uniref:hypothetical protein n=1 Tax=Amycolatopsis sp. NPDC101161 TaxID=3363940 RepID=UPI0038244E89